MIGQLTAVGVLEIAWPSLHEVDKSLWGTNLALEMLFTEGKIQQNL